MQSINVELNTDDMKSYIDTMGWFIDDDTAEQMLEHCEGIFADDNRHIKHFVRMVGSHCATKGIVKTYNHISPSLNDSAQSIKTALSGAKSIQKIIANKKAYGLSEEAKELYTLLDKFMLNPEQFRPKKITQGQTQSTKKDLKRQLRELIKGKFDAIENFVDSLQ